MLVTSSGELSDIGSTLQRDESGILKRLRVTQRREAGPPIRNGVSKTSGNDSEKISPRIEKKKMYSYELEEYIVEYFLVRTINEATGWI